MKTTIAVFALQSLGLIVAIGIVGVGVYLYKDNRKSERFTAKLEALLKREPEVLLTGVGAKEADERARTADVRQIQSIYQKHNDAWCHGDGDAYASVFTEDADFIAFDGSHTTGREAIAASHQELFDRYLQNTCLQGAIERIKFLSADTATVYVLSGTRFDNRQVVRRPSIQTYVAVRQNDRWLFSSFHNGRIDPVQDWNVLRLGWLGAKTWLFRR